MTAGDYHVIQWATGKDGRVAIKHSVQNPDLELVEVYVINMDKVGRDAGEIASIAPINSNILDAKAATRVGGDDERTARLFVSDAVLCTSTGHREANSIIERQIATLEQEARPG
jgi:hypothetical protein